MIRRYPCQIVLLSVLGILAAKGVGMAFVPALLSAGIWISREPLGRKRLRQAVVLLAAFGIGMARMHYVSAEMERQPAGILDGQEISVQGCITKKQIRETQAIQKEVQQKTQKAIQKEVQQETQKAIQQEMQQKTQNETLQEIPYKQTQWIVYLKDSYLKTPQGIRSCGNVIVYLSAGRPVIGNTILVSGKIKLFSTARNEGNFDERAYYQNQGYSFKVYAQEGEASYQEVDVHADKLREFLYDVQQNLQQVYKSRMPKQEAGALSAMLLGEKSLLLDQTKELYRQSGIAHILAISGLHISLLGAAVFRLLRKRGFLSYAAASAVSMGLLVMFGLMAGMGISTVRAVVMFGIYLGAQCAGRAYDSVNGLAVAAAVLLWQNPRILFLAGFQFSFAAVLGVLFGREICRIYKPKLRLAETVFISFGIQMMTLPLTAWYYYEIPVYSVFLNMLVLPLMELVLVLGLLGGGAGVLAGAAAGMQTAAGVIAGMPAAAGAAAGMQTAAGQLCGLASKGLLYGCTVILQYFSKAGKFFLGLPGAVCVIGQPRVWQMAGYYLVLGMCIWVICHMEQNKYLGMKKMQERCRGAAQKEDALKTQENAALKQQKIMVRMGCFLCLFLLFARLPKQAEVAVLDVGQGDGIYIRTSGGADIFIDGGSKDVSKAGAYRILPFLKSQGVSCIDSWFVSHLDQDHVSGLDEILDSGYEIRQVVFAEGVLQDEAYQRLKGRILERQIQVQHLEKGAVLRSKNACFTALAPGTDETADDRNARSLVLLYEDSGFIGFFPGDISAKEEQKLAAEGSLPQASFYKAAHHGSKYSNSEELLGQLKPCVSVISCAEKNDYGHPGAEAAAHMEENSGRVCYTMRDGQIRVCWGRGKIKVQQYIQ